jgi:hypothetical protein
MNTLTYNSAEFISTVESFTLWSNTCVQVSETLNYLLDFVKNVRLECKWAAAMNALACNSAE